MGNGFHPPSEAERSTPIESERKKHRARVDATAQRMLERWREVFDRLRST